MMYALEKSGEWPVKILVVILAMWAATFLYSDYRFKGILLIAIYYFFRKGKWEKLVLGAGWNFVWNWRIQGYGAISSIFIAMYNGEKGRSLKYFFYLFYPLHLLVLYGISSVIQIP